MNGERIGWVLSALLHVAVAVFALVGLPHFVREPVAPPPPIEIEFVKIAEKTEVVAPKEEIKQEETTPEPTPQYAKAEQQAAPVAEAMPLPEPEKKVKDLPKPTPKPVVSEREKLRNSIDVRTKPKAPSRLKSDRIAALIDKSLKDDTQAPKAEEKKEEKVDAKKDEPKPDLLAGIRGRIASASLMDALSQKLAKCWSFPGGAKNIEKMSVTVRIYLRPDGGLARVPEFLDAGDLTDPDRAFYRTFAESARRAVQLCQPYPEAVEFLPSGQGYIDFHFNGAEFGTN